ncbi:sigma-54-dependent Fis family transcriptional regulator [Longibacter salinarum]|uniref:Sigma-54-dependent Fis family transcriptional regulator n=2 Tax=Longibacter salinarum TaxID=1850348 RepID=A0A2A8D1R8_9BACT|nr:sigma-54-dependent Fis family transcriptional regulator [Longibacter salinarum]
MHAAARILIVEDEFAVAMELEDRLENLGYDVVGHELRGREAIQRAEETEPDLVLMDIRLDGRMDGIDAAQQIRTKLHVPVVFVTAYSDDETLERAKETAPFGYVIKPFEERELYASIEVALSTHALERRVARYRDDLRQILDGLNEGTAMTQSDGKLTFVSRSASHMLGKPPSALTDRDWTSALPFPDDTLAVLKRRMSNDSQTVVPVTIEHDDDTQVRLEVSVRRDPRDDSRHIFTFADVTDVHEMRRMLDEKTEFNDIVGKSEPMQQVFQEIRSVASVDATVLIHGETGTGKELVSRAIHDASSRHDGPFIPVNCAAMSKDLAASQLFGHRKGAFTGAVDDHEGYFEAADGGTLFLDEIGDVPLEVQRQLLRVLEERKITRLGETTSRPVDVRIIAATHRDLLEEVDAGNFRQDLLYRIRIARVELPPLRARRSDIPLLVRTFLRRGRATMGKDVERLSDDAMRHLLDYEWPGNVRELRNAVESALIRASGPTLEKEDLPPEIKHDGRISSTRSEPESEAERVRAALEQTNGNRTEAAQLLGISRATLYRRLDEYGIE